jgi:hypothetical protein
MMGSIMKNELEHPLILTAERIVAFYPQMTDQEKENLSAWEKKFVTGNGAYGTNDWPGWKDIVKRLSH